MFKEWGDCVDKSGVATLSCLPTVFQNIVTAALIFAGITAVIFIIIAGYKFMTSGGDPKQVEGARKTMTYAILGLILILLSFAIVRFISISTGVDCIQEIGYKQCSDQAPEASGDKDRKKDGGKKDTDRRNGNNRR